VKVIGKDGGNTGECTRQSNWTIQINLPIRYN
jgi:hypothetical protein